MLLAGKPLDFLAGAIFRFGPLDFVLQGIAPPPQIRFLQGMKYLIDPGRRRFGPLLGRGSSENADVAIFPKVSDLALKINSFSRVAGLPEGPDDAPDGLVGQPIVFQSP